MNIAQQFKQVLQFLEERRKGYKYSLHLSTKNDKWTCSIVGESVEDKSYPHDFVMCQTEDFEQLPTLIKNKAVDLLLKEQQRIEERIIDLQKANEKLVKEYALIKSLKID